MSIYEDKYKSHPIHENLLATKNRLDKLLADNLDPDAIEHVTRLVEVVTYSISWIDNISFILVPEVTFNQLDKIISNINTDLNNWDNNNDVNQLVTANSRADNFLIHLQQIPKVRAPEELSDISESISSFHKSVNSALKSLNNEKNQLAVRLDGLSSRLDEYNAALEKHGSYIDNQKTKIDSIITSFQKQFSEAEDRRRESFNKELKDSIDKIKSDSDNLSEELKEKAIKTIDYLEKVKGDAAKLLNVIGNIGETGNYSKVANQEKRTANNWRLAAISLMLISVAIVGSIVISIAKPDFSWDMAVSRIAVTLIIFAPAIYAARESSGHRQREIRNRKMELELASIGPYLELLPDDKKIEIKSQLTGQFFGQPETGIEKDEPITAGTLFTLLEKLLANLTKK